VREAAMIKKCPECGSEKLLHNKDRGEVVCRSCGLVVEDKMIDFSPEWVEHDESEQTKRRTGAPLTYTQHDQGLGTEIGNSSDIYKLSNKDKFFRLRRWQRRVSTAIERNLQIALSELKRVSSVLSLPHSLEEESARIYTMAVQKGLVKGRGVEQIVAASVYLASRMNDSSLTMDDVCRASNIDKKELGKNYRFIMRKLDIRLMPADPVNYVHKFASRLDLSPMTQTRALKIIESIKKNGLNSGKSPKAIAAGAIYLAAIMHGEKRTQERVALVSNVTEVTIRNRYKEFSERLGLTKHLERAMRKAEA
jgi:transcription initiation factor TFIIB